MTRVRAHVKSRTPDLCAHPFTLVPSLLHPRGASQTIQASWTSQSLACVSVNLKFLSWVKKKALELLRCLLCCLMFLPFERLAGVIPVHLSEWRASLHLIALWDMLKHIQTHGCCTHGWQENSGSVLISLSQQASWPGSLGGRYQVSTGLGSQWGKASL